MAAVDQAISVPRAVPARLAAALTNTLTAKLAIVVHLVTSAVMTSLADVVHLVPHALETENVVPAVEGVVAEAVPAQKVAQMENIAYQIKTVAEMDALIPMPSVVRPINVSMEDNAVVQDVITQPLNNAAMEGGVPNRRYVVDCFAAFLARLATTAHARVMVRLLLSLPIPPIALLPSLPVLMIPLHPSLVPPSLPFLMIVLHPPLVLPLLLLVLLAFLNLVLPLPLVVRLQLHLPRDHRRLPIAILTQGIPFPLVPRPLLSLSFCF